VSARALPAPFQRFSRLLPFALFLAAWQALATSGLIAANFLPSVGA
jgi:ABC-type nitrate/sulfonate/bicarbonate transport system permease component